MLYKSVVMVFLPILLLLSSAGLVSAHSSDKIYTADRFDISAQVLANNIIRVTETEVFHFSGGTFSFVTRSLPTDNTDGINVLSASMDQQSMSEGSSIGQYEVSDGNPITVTWHFLVQPETTHTFTLTYEIEGIVQKHPQQDLIDWKPLPDQHSYTIRSSTITIGYPQSAVLVQKPEVDQGTAAVSTTPGKVIYQASNLGADQFLELGLRFRPGLVSQEPRWQLYPELSIKWLPFMILVGLLIAVLGSVFAVKRYRRYRHSSPNILQLAGLEVSTPPGDLPPAIAGVLVTTNDGDPSWPQALSTIFSLMDRGVIAIAPPVRGGWLIGNTDFHLALLNLPPDLRPHEAVLVSILFQNRSGGVKSLVSIKRAGELYQRQSSAFNKAVQREMAAMEMINPRQQEVRRRLGCISSCVFVLALLLCIVLLFVAPWSLIFLPLGFVVASITGFIVKGTISVYNENSEEAALPWKAFAEYMRLLTLGQGVLGAEACASYLAYATSFGLLTDWTSTMQSYGLLALPPWFRELVTAGYIRDQRQAFGEFNRMSEGAKKAGERSSNSSGGGGGSSMSGSSGAAGGGSSSAG